MIEPPGFYTTGSAISILIDIWQPTSIEPDFHMPRQWNPGSWLLTLPTHVNGTQVRDSWLCQPTSMEPRFVILDFQGWPTSMEPRFEILKDDPRQWNPGSGSCHMCAVIQKMLFFLELWFWSATGVEMLHPPSTLEPRFDGATSYDGVGPRQSSWAG